MVNFINLKVINNIDGFLDCYNFHYNIQSHSLFNFFLSDCDSSERYSVDWTEERGFVVICRIIIALCNGLQKGVWLEENNIFMALQSLKFNLNLPSSCACQVAC